MYGSWNEKFPEISIHLQDGKGVPVSRRLWQRTQPREHPPQDEFPLRRNKDFPSLLNDYENGTMQIAEKEELSKTRFPIKY
jgi:hypothetical protein